MLQKQGRSHNLVFILGLVIASAIFFQSAWIGDDAFITMRVIDNFFHDFGLRWNIHERVQTFSHPLWFLLLIPIFGFFANPYLSLILLSFACWIAFFCICFFKIFERDIKFVCLFFLLLISSKAFSDYICSGLENPLSYLLIALGCFEANRIYFSETPKEECLRRLSVFWGLLLLTRLDLILLILPLYGLIIYLNRSKSVKSIFAFCLPFIAWSIFSVIYYGFPLPNTYYAKVEAGIPQMVLLLHGVKYFWNSLRWDPITLSVITATALFFMKSMGRKASLSKDRKFVFAILLGVIFYFVYILKVGGDFMTGRFFSVPFLFCLLFLFLNENFRDFLNGKMTSIFSLRSAGFSILLLYAILWPSSGWRGLSAVYHFYEREKDIVDERGSYWNDSALIYYTGQEIYPKHQWHLAGYAKRQQSSKIFMDIGVGYLGYGLGPEKILVDIVALGDPLLAHLPTNGAWSIGHYARKPPEGYLESLMQNRNLIKDPEIRSLYDDIILITQGRLFTSKRWHAIWRRNILNRHTEISNRQMLRLWSD